MDKVVDCRTESNKLQIRDAKSYVVLNLEGIFSLNFTVPEVMTHSSGMLNADVGKADGYFLKRQDAMHGWK